MQQYLRKDPQTDRVSLVITTCRKYHRQGFMDFIQARDVAKGLEYLHTMSPGIVHGDLKAVSRSMDHHSISVKLGINNV